MKISGYVGELIFWAKVIKKEFIRFRDIDALNFSNLLPKHQPQQRPVELEQAIFL